MGDTQSRSARSAAAVVGIFVAIACSANADIARAVSVPIAGKRSSCADAKDVLSRQSRREQSARIMIAETLSCGLT